MRTSIPAAIGQSFENFTSEELVNFFQSQPELAGKQVYRVDVFSFFVQIWFRNSEGKISHYSVDY